MLDFSDPKFWTDGVKVVIAAPQIVVPLLVIVAVATWWFRGAIEGGTRRGEAAAQKGLEKEIGGLKAQIAALEERLRLAQDSERTVARKSTELETQMATLNAQIVAGAPPERLMGVTSTISSTASEIKVANTEIGKALYPGPTGFLPSFLPGGDHKSLGKKTKP